MQKAIAFELKKKIGNQVKDSAQVAWIEHKGVVYFSLHEPKDNEPQTVVTKLIQFLFEEFVDHSFFILRERIWTTGPVTPMCDGMVKLAAKRITGNILPEAGELSNFEWRQVAGLEDPLLASQYVERPSVHLPSHLSSPKEISEALEQLKKAVARGQVLHDFNRTISAILVDKEGLILDWTVNSNSKNKTLHAEVLLMQRYFSKHQSALPNGAKVYVSLKPCKMCSAMLAEMMVDGDAVYFVEDDPGPLAKKTELEARGLLHQLRV